MRTLVIAALTAALLSPAAAAQPGPATLVVDASGGPGAQFTALQPAIDAANPGDVLLVRPGSYRAFTLSKGLAIVGVNPVVVDPGCVIRAVPAGQQVNLRELFLGSLRIEGCQGLVVADVLNLTPPSTPTGPGDVAALEVVDSADVRMRQFGINPGRNSGRDGVRVLNARFAVDGAAIDGAAGSATGIGLDGGVGLRCLGGADVQVSFSRVRGGAGAPGAQGGVAIQVAAGARLAVTGSEENEVIGSSGSIFGCSQPGAAFLVERGGAVRLAHRVQVRGGTSLCAPTAPAFTGPGAVTVANPVDLSLAVRGGIAAVGVPSQLLVLGEVGASVAVLAGVQPTRSPLPAFQGSPLLVAPVASLVLGTIQPSGDLIVDVGEPSGAPGQAVLLQAVSLRVGGALFLSNATALIGAP